MEHSMTIAKIWHELIHANKLPINGVISEGEYVVFFCTTAQARSWLIKTIKTNFNLIDEFVGFELVKEVGLKILSSHNPLRISNFRFDYFPIPVSPKTNKSLYEENLPKDGDNFFVELRKRFLSTNEPKVFLMGWSHSVLPVSEQPKILPSPFTKNQSEHESIVNAHFNEYKDSLEKQTWEEYFSEFGFSVVVTPKIVNMERSGEKQIGCYIEFGSISELKQFRLKPKSIGKQYNFCEVPAKPNTLFTVWLNPLLRD